MHVFIALTIVVSTQITRGISVTSIQEKSFDKKYPDLLTYHKWKTMGAEHNTLQLKYLCNRSALNFNYNIHAEPKVIKRIRQQVKYKSYPKPRMIRLDLLLCDVTFVNANGLDVGGTKFFLAEGAEPNTVFKLVPVHDCLHLVDVIKHDMKPHRLNRLSSLVRTARAHNDFRTLANINQLLLSPSTSPTSAGSSPSSGSSTPSSSSSPRFFGARGISPPKTISILENSILPSYPILSFNK